jgi:TRAP-type C4-dicarboxylate transport system substrate-binding protein
MMKKIALLAAALTFAVAGQAQTRWDLPSGYSANTFQVQNLQQFADEVNQLTNGRLRITIHPGGSLFRQQEIKRAVQTNQAQIGEFIISGVANENPLFGIDSIPFLATSYADAMRLYQAAGPVQARILESQGMKVLFSVPWPGQSLYSTRPIAGPEDFRGTRMRAFNPATTRIARLLGAQPVTVQLPELPQAIATGTVNNFLTSSASGVESRLYEQVRHFYPVNAWLPRNVTVVSLRAFNALDAETQQAVLRAAAAAEERGWATSERLDKEFVQQLAANGMTVSEPPASVSAALKTIGETMLQEWLSTAGADGQAVINTFNRR